MKYLGKIMCAVGLHKWIEFCSRPTYGDNRLIGSRIVGEQCERCNVRAQFIKD